MINAVSTALGAAVVLTAVHAHAATIAAQDFEGNSTATGTFSNDFPNDDPGLLFDSGVGLGWSVSFSDTRGTGETGPVAGGDGGDLIGVVNAGIASATNGNGNNDNSNSAGATGNFFNSDDGDGAILLAFDQIDATGFENLMLDFTWAVESTGYESTDVFDVSVNGTSVFNVSGDDLVSGGFVDAFAAVSVDLTAFDMSLLDIVVSFDNNSSSEDMAFDNLVVSGDAVGGTDVPLPASALLLLSALGALAATRRRV